jgi:glycosyltransferase involved in cell wall biosynthesis
MEAKDQPIRQSLGHQHEAEEASAPAHKSLPITVVIPIRNEIASIDALLQAVFAQVPAPAAVIAVDAGSDDGTRQVLNNWRVRQPNFSIIEVEKAFPGEARNLGTEKATTPWVAYLDAGTLPDADWLTQLWQVAIGSSASAVYGYFRPLVHNSVARWFALAVMPGARPKDGGLMRIHSITCSLVRVSAWKAIGGFPPFRAAEDRIFMKALAALGPIDEAPAAAITWHSPQDWPGVWRRTALLAEHSARAGRSRDWHWPTLRLWLAGLLAAAVIPWPVNTGLIGGALGLRAWRRIRRHRLDPELCRRHWADLPGVALMLTVVDLALFTGWFLRVRRP